MNYNIDIYYHPESFPFNQDNLIKSLRRKASLKHVCISCIRKFITSWVRICVIVTLGEIILLMTHGIHDVPVLQLLSLLTFASHCTAECRAGLLFASVLAELSGVRHNVP